MKILYYDCSVGISGDMNLAALISLGIDEDYLANELKKLNIDEEFELKIYDDIKMGVTGKKVDVVLLNQNDHDHDSHSYDHDHNHHHDHDHDHDHNHDHHHGDHTHAHNESHHHRTFSIIKKMINDSELSDTVKDLSIKMFKNIAIAEGKVHGKDYTEVHFHEVGATDSIIDIVGAAICIDYLKVDVIKASTIQLGGGFVNCAHGKIAVPAPATLEILKETPVRTGLVPFETTTPTGATILKSIVSEYTDDVAMNIRKIGYGLGTKNFEVPNVLRVFIGEEKNIKSDKEQCMIEANFDDMNGEIFTYLESKLFSMGARDVFKKSIIMKKGRPGVLLSVLTEKESLQLFIDTLLKETTTGGIRWYAVNKVEMDRSFETCMTTYGPVTIKKFYYKDEFIKEKPEFSSCKKLAEKHNVSILEIYEAIKKERTSNEQQV